MKKNAIAFNEKGSLEGVVVSTKMQKTILVEVVRRYKHKVLGKIVNSSKKYKVHDEDGVANLGDRVEAFECRPLSKSKHMVLGRVLRKSNQV
jgi:small subunit ribosomal protein S17